MRSRAQRLRDRRGHRGAPQEFGPAGTFGGATDDIDGLGRLEQLVLRGDGLTTTSLEILTGHRIEVEVSGHWTISVPHGSAAPTSTMHAEIGAPGVDERLQVAQVELDAGPGDELLVRDVLLVGAFGAVHGAAEVVARRAALPDVVAHTLATTDQPIGRLLRDSDVPVTRELRRWGLLPAGAQAARLGPDLVPSSRVPGRTYVMRMSSDGSPLAVLTERFAPHVFVPAPRRAS